MSSYMEVSKNMIGVLAQVNKKNESVTTLVDFIRKNLILSNSEKPFLKGLI